MRRCIGPFAIDVTFIMTYQRVKSKKGEIKKLRHNYKKTGLAVALGVDQKVFARWRHDEGADGVKGGQFFGVVVVGVIVFVHILRACEALQVVTCYQFISQPRACKVFIRYVYNLLNSTGGRGRSVHLCNS